MIIILSFGLPSCEIDTCKGTLIWNEWHGSKASILLKQLQWLKVSTAQWLCNTSMRSA